MTPRRCSRCSGRPVSAPSTCGRGAAPIRLRSARFGRLLRRGQFDIVHVHSFRTELGATILGRRARAVLAPDPHRPQRRRVLRQSALRARSRRCRRRGWTGSWRSRTPWPTTSATRPACPARRSCGSTTASTRRRSDRTCCRRRVGRPATRCARRPSACWRGWRRRRGTASCSTRCPRSWRPSPTCECGSLGTRNRARSPSFGRYADELGVAD